MATMPKIFKNVVSVLLLGFFPLVQGGLVSLKLDDSVPSYTTVQVVQPLSFLQTTPPPSNCKPVSPDTTSENRKGVSIDANGIGTFAGASWSCSGYATCHVTADLGIMGMSSVDVENLNALVKSTLSSSQYKRVTDKKDLDVAVYGGFGGFGVLGIFGTLFGGIGAKVTYEETHKSEEGFGLTEKQIDTLEKALFQAASKMSYLTLDSEIDNSKNMESVDGSLELYTIGGTIRRNDTECKFQMLSDKGSVGLGQDGAVNTGVKALPHA